jgi:homogentisate 1,2-dioxygenase
MTHYRSCGDIPPKRHTQHRRPDGGLYSEELMGEEGFSSDSSLLYHIGVPSAIVDAMTWEPGDLGTTRSSRGTCGCTTWSPARTGRRSTR